MMHGQRVTLDNVFELAKKEGKQADESQSEESNDSEDDGATHIKESQRIVSNDLLQQQPELKSPSDDKRDQSLVRPKVLILAPFKKMAYEIIEQIVLLCNEGKWKRVSKKKKFMEEFATEEEAYNDFFREMVCDNTLGEQTGLKRERSMSMDEISFQWAAITLVTLNY